MLRNSTDFAIPVIRAVLVFVPYVAFSLPASNYCYICQVSYEQKDTHMQF